MIVIGATLLCGVSIAPIRRVWLGVEVDPTWRGVDLETFAYPPSLIGLVAAFAVAQVEHHGTLTPQMALWAACWWLYLFTHHRDESGLLSMWDDRVLMQYSLASATASPRATPV